MSEQQPETPAEPLTLSAVAQMIDEKLGAFVGKLFDSGKADVVESGGKPGGDPARGRDRDDVTAAVRAEVAKLRDDEARRASEKSMAERVAELEKQLKAVTEAVPEEYRKITQRMWA